MQWNKAQEMPPKPEDSPILAWVREEEEDYCASLIWLDKTVSRWRTPGWYELARDRAYMSTLEEITWWAPLPLPPKETK